MRGSMVTKRLAGPDRRAQLLDHARGVFAAEGYHRASMDQIAASAGVTKPVLYQHFSSKKELYLALLELDGQRLLQEVADAIKDTSGGQRIKRGLGAYFRFIDRETDSFRVLFRETMATEPEFREAIDRFHDMAAGAIGAIIAEETGKDADESELLARGMVGMAEATAAWWLDRKPHIQLEGIVADLTELAWRGLASLPRKED
ncbi:MAG: TetR family transcriptional regulator [Actinomycetota bacterium]